MAKINAFCLDFRTAVLGAVLGLVFWASPAMAGGGNVLPACADAKGYSLQDLARATAVYNTGLSVSSPLTPPPPKIPFEILVSNATVKPGTMLYVPVYFADDSATPVPGFPTDIRDQDEDADYLDSVVLNEFGVEDFVIEVDGKTKILSDDYIVGVKTPPLLDGPPAGTHYIVSAAVLTPLTPGTHTVSIGGIIDGEPAVFVAYSVTVK